jgi:hypothetical protein
MGTPPRTPRRPPIPREEPEEQEAEEDPKSARQEPTTLRPPGFGVNEAASQSYKMLSESCRVPDAAETPLDDELAIEAEIVRVALDRTSQKLKK